MKFKDLLEPNENDPVELKQARIDEERIILKWIEDYNKANALHRFAKRKQI